MKPSPVAVTTCYLRSCIAARDRGWPVAYTTDPRWLVNMAVNRRAGWPDDPTHARGSCCPTERGRYPRKAEGDGYLRHLYQIARRVNTPRLIVRPAELGEHRWLLERIPHRFTFED